MAVNFDNRVSWMDVFSILIACAGGAYVVFEQGADIEKLEAELGYTQEQVQRIEAASIRTKDEITEQIESLRDEQRLQYEGIRTEQRQQYDKLDQKLDKLIDRELRRNGH